MPKTRPPNGRKAKATANTAKVFNSEEEAIEAFMVLVRVADDEGAGGQPGRAGDERDDGAQLLLTGQRDDDLTLARARLPLEVAVGEELGNHRINAHGMTAEGMPTSRVAIHGVPKRG